jgi:hypothetical protein
MNLIGTSAWETRSSKMEIGNHLNIYLKTEENQENVCREARLQDLPDAH